MESPGRNAAVDDETLQVQDIAVHSNRAYEPLTSPEERVGDTEHGNVAVAQGLEISTDPLAENTANVGDEGVQHVPPGLAEQSSGQVTTVPCTSDQVTSTSREEVVEPTTSPTKHSQSEHSVAVPNKKRRSESPCSSSDDEGQTCSICFEPWTTSGEHRIASLHCGHLFGSSCIKKWLNNRHAKCPQCKARARRCDIRLIYAKSLKVLDTSERDRVLQELEKEKELRRKNEIDLAQTRFRCQQAEYEIQRLKNELRRVNSYHRLGMPGASREDACSSSHHSKNLQLFLKKSIDICGDNSCRVMAACNYMNMLVVNKFFKHPLFPGFGVKKINTLSLEVIEYVHIHSNIVRDMAFSPSTHDGLLLTASMDHTVRLTNMLSNSVVLSYQTHAPVWSCAWNRNNPLQFYAGLQNGITLLFDTRQTNGYIDMLVTEGSSSPVVALQSVNYQPVSSFCQGGVISGQLERTIFYESRGNEFIPHMLPIEGTLTSLSFDPKTRHLLASCRPNKRHVNVRHSLCEMTSRNRSSNPTIIDNVCSCNIIEVYEGGNRQALLSRSTLIPHPTHEGSFYVCAGDEVKGALLVWSVESGKRVQDYPVPSAVMDVCALDSRNLAVLLSDSVRVYSMT